MNSSDYIPYCLQRLSIDSLFVDELQNKIPQIADRVSLARQFGLFDTFGLLSMAGHNLIQGLNDNIFVLGKWLSSVEVENYASDYRLNVNQKNAASRELGAEIVAQSRRVSPLFRLSESGAQAKISDIIENQRYRPVGYYEDVMSRGVVQGDRVEMPYEEAVSLVEKYSEKNPTNGVKSDAAVWGPILWKVLHDRAAEYAMAIDAETRWLKIFQSWIPCGECKSHFRRLVSEMPPDLSSRKKYAKWAVDVHNKVNESLGKPIFSV